MRLTVASLTPTFLATSARRRDMAKSCKNLQCIASLALPGGSPRPYAVGMPQKVVALGRSTHPAPAIAVTVITVLLGVSTGLELWRVAVLGLAMVLDQASVGLSNDWIDAERDRAVGRTDKP